MNNSTRKSALNRFYSVAEAQNKPEYLGCKYIDDAQYFCNGSTVVMLNTGKFDTPDMENSEWIDVKKVLEIAESKNDFEIPVMDYNELKAYIRELKEQYKQGVRNRIIRKPKKGKAQFYKIFKIGKKELGVNAEFLLTVYELLDEPVTKIMALRDHPIDPIYIETEHNKALLLPVRLTPTTN